MCNSLVKSPAYRSRKLLDLAHRVNECQLQIPSVCVWYSPDGCEPVHADWQEYGKSMGRKAEDYYHAAGCHACHVFLGEAKAPRALKKEVWQSGWQRTMAYYFDQGWIGVVK